MPSDRRPADNHRLPHSDLALCFLQVAVAASQRALRGSQCPDVRHLVECAHQNLAAARDLIRTDREWAA